MLQLHLRHCGSFDSCSTAKLAAEGLLTTASLKLRLPLEDYEEFVPPSSTSESLSCHWQRFTSFEAIPVDISCHFLLFCRHSVVEVASFKSPHAVLSLPYPPALKPQRQLFTSLLLQPYSESIDDDEESDQEFSSAESILQAIRIVAETKCVATHWAHCLKFSRKLPKEQAVVVAPLFSWMRISKSFVKELLQVTKGPEVSLSDALIGDVQDTQEWKSYQQDLEKFRESEEKISAISRQPQETHAFWTEDAMFPLDQMPRTGLKAKLNVFGREVVPEKRLEDLEPDVKSRTRAIHLNQTLCTHEQLMRRLPLTLEHTRPGQSSEAEGIMKEVSGGKMVFRPHDTSWMKHPKRLEKTLAGYLFLERVKMLEALETTPSPSDAAAAILRKCEVAAELMAAKKVQQQRSSDRKVRPGTAPARSRK